MENKLLSHKEHIMSVTNFAIKNNIPALNFFDMYNKVNDVLYRVFNDNSLYNQAIEEITFESMKRYFSRLN